jgi:hypothetical protein
MTRAAPDFSQSIQDPGLRNLPANDTAVFALIGPAVSGTVNTVYSYAGLDFQTAIDDLAGGMLLEEVVYHLAKSGGQQVLVVPATKTNGSNSAVTASGGGPTVTLSGTPNDYYEIIVLITLGGAVGTSTFQYSLDGGDSYSEVITTASTYLLLTPGTETSTGVTVNFAAGTYVIDETYSATSTGPTISTTNLATAIDALHADPRRFGLLKLVGHGADAAATEAIATVLQSKATTAFAAGRPYRAILECPPVAASTIISEFAGYAAARVSPVAGFCELVSEVTGQIEKRSVGWWYAAHLAEIPISVAASRNATDSDLGPAVGINELVPSGSAASTGYHDERVTPGLNAARVTCMTTKTEVEGFYIVHGKLLAASGSDFDLIQYGRVMDRACVLNAAASVKYQGKRARTNSDGTIEEGYAASIETDLTQRVAAGLGNDVQAVQVLVDRTVDLSATGLLKTKVRIKPWDYTDFIESEIGFAVDVPLAA